MPSGAMSPAVKPEGPKILASADKVLRPDFKRPEYEAAQKTRDLCDALMIGTRAIQEGGETFLAKWPAEKEKHYDIRRKIVQVTRYYRRIVEAVVGMICATPPSLAPDSDPLLLELAEDVDGQGTHLEVFAKTIMLDAVNGGFVGILVDYPPIPAGARLRLDQEQALGLRPFMVRIPAERIYSWIVEVPDWEGLIAAYLAGTIDAETAVAYAKQIITRQVVIYEPTDVVMAGAFGATTAHRYRVLRLTDAGVTYRVWEKRKDDAGQEYFTVISDGVMTAKRKPLREIPLAVVYGGMKTAPFVADPPLAPVAELNLDHHSISSDRRYLMRLCHAPTLFLAGFTEEQDREGKAIPLQVGPNSVLRSVNTDAKAAYVAADPAALDSSQVEKREVVQQIQAIGMAFVGADRKTSDTATGRQLDDAAENASTATVSRGGKDGLEQAWRFMAMHVGGPRTVEAPSMVMQTTYASPRIDPQIAALLWAAVAKGALDVESWIEYIRTGELPEDIKLRLDYLRVVTAEAEAGQADDGADPQDDAVTEGDAAPAVAA